MSRSRTAIATIRGFNYQFDASIRLIREAGSDDSVTCTEVKENSANAKPAGKSRSAANFPNNTNTPTTMNNIPHS